MKKMFRKVLTCFAFIAVAVGFSASRSEAQGGFCYGRGGWISVGSTGVFVCPMGGGTELCAWPCGGGHQ